MTPHPQQEYTITESELEEWEAGGMCWSEEKELQAAIRSRPAPAAPTYIRPEVMAFARAMEDTLRKYDGKKTHWRDVSVSFGYLFGRISDELKEAKAEYNVRVPDYDKCIMELVDTANFCMMCYDKIRPADTRPAPAASRDKEVLDLLKKKITWGKEIDRNHLFDYHNIEQMIDEAEQRVQSLRSTPTAQEHHEGE